MHFRLETNRAIVSEACLLLSARITHGGVNGTHVQLVRYANSQLFELGDRLHWEPPNSLLVRYTLKLLNYVRYWHKRTSQQVIAK
jgi:hypothetical protein